jgi:predicted dehydrogenase
VLGSFHINKCKLNPQINLCGFFDSNPERRAAVAEQTGIVAYESIPELLRDVQAVILATPASTHLEMGRVCLNAGKHLLIEKPLAESQSEGQELVNLAARNMVILHVGHSEAHNAAFSRLMTYKPKPMFIEVHRLASYSPRGTDVSVVLDLMVHDIQLILRLCGEEPIYEAIAATGVPVVSDDIDIANVRLTFPSGCVANLTASRFSAKRMRKLRLFEKDNYFSVDLNKGEIEHYSLIREPVVPPALPFSLVNETVESVDALETEQQAFIDAITGAKPDAGVTGAEALAILRVTDAILSRIAARPVM